MRMKLIPAFVIWYYLLTITLLQSLPHHPLEVSEDRWWWFWPEAQNRSAAWRRPWPPFSRNTVLALRHLQYLHFHSNSWFSQYRTDCMCLVICKSGVEKKRIREISEQKQNRIVVEMAVVSLYQVVKTAFSKAQERIEVVCVMWDNIPQIGLQRPQGECSESVLTWWLVLAEGRWESQFGRKAKNQTIRDLGY